MTGGMRMKKLICLVLLVVLAMYGCAQKGIVVTPDAGEPGTVTAAETPASADALSSDIDSIGAEVSSIDADDDVGDPVVPISAAELED